MDRRDFIKSSCYTCAAVVGASLLLPGCTTAKHVTNFAIDKHILSVRKAEFTMIKKQKATEQKYILVKPDSFNFPIAVYKINESEYTALLLECTHQGCELTPFETTLVCPCHGAEFDKRGSVTQGPAENKLKSYVTTHDDVNVYIQLKS